MYKNQALAHSGMSYFMLGFKLIQRKGLRRFVFIPLIINLILFSASFYYIFAQLDQYISLVMSYLPEMLQWLSVVIWPFAVISILVVASFFFSTIANWIGAPFNGLLAEKLELLLTNQPIANQTSVIKDVPRLLAREWVKLKYYLPRAIGFFIIMMILPIAGQIIWFLFTAWMMAIQYLDYPFDNHKVGFDEMKTTLSQHKNYSYGFGIATTVFAMIPFVNLIVMPVAVCGATAMWVERFKADFH